jgi:hypothetical protein
LSQYLTHLLLTSGKDLYYPVAFVHAVLRHRGNLVMALPYWLFWLVLLLVYLGMLSQIIVEWEVIVKEVTITYFKRLCHHFHGGT